MICLEVFSNNTSFSCAMRDSVMELILCNDQSTSEVIFFTDRHTFNPNSSLDVGVEGRARLPKSNLITFDRLKQSGYTYTRIHLIKIAKYFTRSTNLKFCSRLYFANGEF